MLHHHHGKGRKYTMSSKIFSKANSLRITLATLALIISLVAVIGGSHVREGYEISVGAVSPMRFSAPNQIINIYQTNLNREAAARAAENIAPVTALDTDIKYQVIEELSHFFEVSQIARETYRDELEQYFEALEVLAAAQRQALIEQAAALAEQANNTQEGGAITLATPDPPTETVIELPQFPDPLDVPIPIHLNDNLTRLFVEMDDDAFEIMHSEVISVTETIMDNGIIRLDIPSLLAIQSAIQERGLPSDVTQLAYEIISSYIVPNIFENEVETELVRERVAAEYVTVYYYQHQLIIDANAIVTEEAFLALQQLNLIRTDDNIINIPLIIGTVILVSLAYLVAIAYLYVFSRQSFVNNKEALLLFTLYIVVIGVTWVISSTPAIPYIFVPLLILCMLLVMFFSTRVALVVSISATVICAMVVQAQMDFIIYFTLMSINISLIANYTTTRQRIMFAGASAAVLSALVYISLAIFMTRSFSQEMLILSAWAAASGLLTVVVAVGTSPFWEFAFGAITSFRLIELSNPNNPVLRKLSIEAPGTYHHSLIVANLAEAAAYEVGANPYLTRAGAYYHDIGKLKYPLFFAENQGNDNPHNDIDPLESCRVLATHIDYGLELAARYKLPKIIRDIIEQHQGNTVMKYFYNKAVELADGEVVDEGEYRYNFSPPQSKEAGLIMLADTIEAAVRSRIQKVNSFSEIESLIRSLIKDKIDDGQLIDSGLTLRDIEDSTQAFINVLRAMNHERISYEPIKTEENPE